MAYQAYDPGGKPAGFQVYDISKPAEPREITFYDLSGADDHSVGVHYVSFMDGRYAHLCASHPDFVPNHKDDNQFYMIVDLANPSKPTEVGRWWLPGQRKGDKEPPLEHHVAPSLHFGMRPHHTLCYPERPDRAYIGYIDAGIVILDIADKAHPEAGEPARLPSAVPRLHAHRAAALRTAICSSSPTRRPATTGSTGRSAAGWWTRGWKRTR